MAQITVDERSVQWRAAVGRVRQAVGVTFYADIAELLYNDSHPDRFADLSNKVWTKHVRYVTEELTRSERNLSDAKMAMYAKPILAVCRDQTETRDEFLEYMKILFATPEKSRDESYGGARNRPNVGSTRFAAHGCEPNSRSRTSSASCRKTEEKRATTSARDGERRMQMPMTAWMTAYKGVGAPGDLPAIQTPPDRLTRPRH